MVKGGCYPPLDLNYLELTIGFHVSWMYTWYTLWSNGPHKNCCNVLKYWSVSMLGNHIVEWTTPCVWLGCIPRPGSYEWTVHVIWTNPKTRGITNKLYIWIKWVLLPFTFVRTNIYSRLVSKYIEGFMPVALASLIEVHWHIFILLWYVIGFNPSNVYTLLYGAPTYDDIYICS